jgi:hypothetical protein
MRNCAKLVFLFLLPAFALAQSRPPMLPGATLDTTCCPYPRLRLPDLYGTVLAVQAAVPTADVSAALSNLRLMLPALERGTPTAHRINLVRTNLVNLSSTLAGRYDLSAFYLELQHHRRRLPASEEAGYALDSIRWVRWEAEADSVASAREQLAPQPALTYVSKPITYWVFTCGNHGHRTHTSLQCPVVQWSQEELVNITQAQAISDKLRHCAWCARFGGVRIHPASR